MVWRKPWQFAIYELEMWILGRSRDSWESKWRMNRDDKALKRPSKTWIILGRMWTFQSQYSSHWTSRYFPFIYRALKPSNIVECFSFCTVTEVSNINKAKRVLISCGHPSFGSAKESTLWHFWQYCETETHVWGIWGFIVLKKIEYGSRFFHYKTTNIIHWAKDLSIFIIRFLKLD